MKFFIGIITILTLINVASANVSFLNYKDTSSGLDSYDDATFEKLFNGASPVCVKDGAKLKGVNRAFKKNGLGYRDCSKSKKTRLKHEKLGISVTVIPMYSLSSKYVRMLNKR